MIMLTRLTGPELIFTRLVNSELKPQKCIFVAFYVDPDGGAEHQRKNNKLTKEKNDRSLVTA